MKQLIRTRIAPSPTGEDLHIGSVYMALFNYVFAKKNKGQFIVRIEDTDQERYVKGAEQKMMASLAWVGISHDEGVDTGGPHSPYRQSERLPLYKKYAEELVTKGSAYYCFCTSERLTELRKVQQKNHHPPMYDGLCKRLLPEKALEKSKIEKCVIRLNVPDSGETTFTDLVRGHITFQNNLLDDQVLLKSDGFPTYHLAVVVDDHLMEISHVIRGEEWISSTPKHILLYQMFDWKIPLYAHLPVLRNPDKSKLSKRKNPVWLSWFKHEGFLPEAILNYLGTVTWGVPDGRDIFDVPFMIQTFELTHVKTTAPIFDLTKLTWMNGEYIRAATNDYLYKRLQPFAGKDTELVKKLIPLAKERMKTLKEFTLYLKPFTFFSPFSLNSEEKDTVHKFLKLYESVLPWKTKKLEEISKEFLEKEALEIRDAFMALRLGVTGEKVGLPLFETLEILGKEEVVRRLKLTL